MAFRSLSPTVTLEDPKSDCKTARRIEQVKVSRQAVYIPAFPGMTYLPLQAVRQAWSQSTSLPLTGSCGKSLPMVAVRVRYEGGFYHNFLFEKQQSADRFLEILAENCPGVILEPEPPKSAQSQ